MEEFRAPKRQRRPAPAVADGNKASASCVLPTRQLLAMLFVSRSDVTRLMAASANLELLGFPVQPATALHGAFIAVGMGSSITVRRVISFDGGTSVRREGLGTGQTDVHQLSDVLDATPDNAQWAQAEAELAARMLEGSVRRITANEVRYTVTRLTLLQRCHLALERHRQSQQQHQQPRSGGATSSSAREAEEQLRDELYDTLSGYLWAGSTWAGIRKRLQAWSPEAAGTLLAAALTHRSSPLPPQPQALSQLQAGPQPESQLQLEPELQRQPQPQAEPQPRPHANPDRTQRLEGAPGALQPELVMQSGLAAATAAAAGSTAHHHPEVLPDQQTHCAPPPASLQAQPTGAAAAPPSPPPVPLAPADTSLVTPLAPPSPAGPRTGPHPSGQAPPLPPPPAPQRQQQQQQHELVKDEDMGVGRPVGPAESSQAPSLPCPPLAPAPAPTPAPAAEVPAFQNCQQVRHGISADGGDRVKSPRDLHPHPPAPHVKAEPSPPQASARPPAAACNLASSNHPSPTSAPQAGRRGVEDLPTYLQPRPRQQVSADPRVGGGGGGAAAAPAAAGGAATANCAAAPDAMPRPCGGPSIGQGSAVTAVASARAGSAATDPGAGAVPAPPSSGGASGLEPVKRELVGEKQAAMGSALGGVTAATSAASEQVPGQQALQGQGEQADGEQQQPQPRQQQPQAQAPQQPRAQREQQQPEHSEHQPRLQQLPQPQQQEQRSHREQRQQDREHYKEQMLQVREHHREQRLAQQQRQQQEPPPPCASLPALAPSGPPLPSCFSPSHRGPSIVRTTSAPYRATLVPSRLATAASASVPAAHAAPGEQAKDLRPVVGEQVPVTSATSAGKAATHGSLHATARAPAGGLARAGSVTWYSSAAAAAAPGAADTAMQPLPAVTTAARSPSHGVSKTTIGIISAGQEPPAAQLNPGPASQPRPAAEAAAALRTAFNMPAVPPASAAATTAPAVAATAAAPRALESHRSLPTAASGGAGGGGATFNVLTMLGSNAGAGVSRRGSSSMAVPLAISGSGTMSSPVAATTAATPAATADAHADRMQLLQRLSADLAEIRAKAASQQAAELQRQLGVEQLRQQREKEREQQLAHWAQQERQRCLQRLQEQQNQSGGRAAAAHSGGGGDDQASHAGVSGGVGGEEEEEEGYTEYGDEGDGGEGMEIDSLPAVSDSVGGTASRGRDGSEQWQQQDCQGGRGGGGAGATRRPPRKPKAASKLGWARRVRAFLSKQPKRRATYGEVVRAGMAIPDFVVKPDNYHGVLNYLRRPCFKAFIRVVRTMKKGGEEFCELEATWAGGGGKAALPRGGAAAAAAAGGRAGDDAGGNVPAGGGDGIPMCECGGSVVADGSAVTAISGGGGGGVWSGGGGVWSGGGGVDPASGGDGGGGGSSQAVGASVSGGGHGGDAWAPRVESELSYSRRLYDHLMSHPDGLGIGEIGRSALRVPPHLLAGTNVRKWIAQRKRHFGFRGTKLVAWIGKRP